MTENKVKNENVTSVATEIQEAELIPLSNAAMFGLVMAKEKNCKGEISTALGNVLKYIETQEPNDEYTHGLHDDVKQYNKDPKRREAIMTVKDDEDLLKFIIEKKDAELAAKDVVIAEKDAELANSAIDINALREQLRAAGLVPVV